MEENSTYQDPQNTEEAELSHSDKMIGIFTEPGKTFGKMAMFPPRTIDWVVPVLILFLFVAVSQILMMTNDEIAFQVKQKTVENLKKNFDEAVKKGQLTQEQADEQVDKIIDNMEAGRGPVGYIIQSVSIFIVGFIIIFIVAAVHFLFGKVIFKDTGTYVSALVANGLPAYITILQVVLAAIISITMGRMISDLSVASLMNVDKTTYLGFILGKIDPITIWAYSVVSIGLAKMFKSDNKEKYFMVVFGFWIGITFLLFLVARAVPFLSFLAGQ